MCKRREIMLALPNRNWNSPQRIECNKTGIPPLRKGKKETRGKAIKKSRERKKGNEGKGEKERKAKRKGG